MSQTVMLTAKMSKMSMFGTIFLKTPPFCKKNIFKLRTGIKISFKIIKCVI